MSYSSSGQKNLYYKAALIVNADYNGSYWYVSIQNKLVIDKIGFCSISVISAEDVDSIFANIRYFHGLALKELDEGAWE